MDGPPSASSWCTQAREAIVETPVLAFEKKISTD